MRRMTPPSLLVRCYPACAYHKRNRRTADKIAQIAGEGVLRRLQAGKIHNGVETSGRECWSWAGPCLHQTLPAVAAGLCKC